MPKIVYDRRHCAGHFVCVTLDPASFAEGDEGGEDKADLLGSGIEEIEDGLWVKQIDEEDLDDAVQAAVGCPADVIKVLDDEGQVIEGPRTLPIER